MFKKKKQQPQRIVKKVKIPVRDNVPLSVFYPEEKRRMKQDTNYFDTLLTYADKKQIIQKFPPVQNKESDLFFAEKSFLKINNGKKIPGAVALTLHFVGFFKFNNDFTYSLIRCVHIYDIYSIRIKQNNKTLLYCRIENEGQNDEVLNVHVNSPFAIEFTQTLYRNYMLSTVAYDSYETCDFRTYDESLFPPFDNGLSPSQGYQLTYFCFCSRLRLPYNHEFTRFYHEHICNFDGFFDFSLIFDSTNLRPAIYAMMFVPYVMAIICHKVKIENISQSIELIIKRSNYLRALHLSGCDIDQDGIRRIGESLVDNLETYKTRIASRDPKYAGYQKKYPDPIPVQYWNFENNKLVDATSFFQGLKDPAFTANVFYLSFSNCRIHDISGLFDAVSSNPHLHQIKYFFFNGNQKVGADEMAKFVKHLNYLADNAKTEKRKNKAKVCLYESIGVSGKGKALEMLFQTLINRQFPIKELSLAGSSIDRKSTTQFYTPSRGAAAIIDFFNNASQLELIDLSSIECDKQDLALILKGMNRSEMLKRIHVKLNHIKKSEKDYEPLLSAAKAFLYTNMEKWESLEFADNYLTGFELDFLLSLFLKMPNLTMLNLSYNFHKDDRAVSQVLFKLHQLNLTKLYIAGRFDTQRYLQTQISDLLAKLIEQKRLEELDISGNLMGDKCYEFVIQILRNCPNLRTLIIDNNKPKNFQLFDDAIHQAMQKRNLTFFPFPSRDLMHIFHHCSGVKALDEEELSQFRWYLINLRYECIGKINKHRKKVGMPPQLPFKSVPELGDMVNEVNAEMKKLLQNIKFYIHGGVAIDIKVPLPYLHENQEFANGTNISTFEPQDYDPEEIINKYHVKNIFKRIDESQINKIYDDQITVIRGKLDRMARMQNDPTATGQNNNNDQGGVQAGQYDPSKKTDETGIQNTNTNDDQNGEKSYVYEYEYEEEEEEEEEYEEEEEEEEETYKPHKHKDKKKHSNKAYAEDKPNKNLGNKGKGSSSKKNKNEGHKFDEQTTTKNKKSHKNLRSPGSPPDEPPRPKPPTRRPPLPEQINYDDDDDGDDSDNGYMPDSDQDSDPDDPAYNVPKRKPNKKHKELDDYEDNIGEISKYTGYKNGTMPLSSGTGYNPPPFYD